MIENKIFSEKLSANKINYSKIKDESSFLLNGEEDCYINFIIPARGRVELSKPLYECFLKASNKSNRKISFTFVEHSEVPEHKSYFENKKVNYIHIVSNKDEKFNKCLCYNIGALYTPKPKYYIFHDLDIIMQSNFFLLLETYTLNGINALQCYTKRRVLSCDKNLTKDLIKGNMNVNSLIEESDGIIPLTPGSTGGSILVAKQLFFNVGGFDPELFHSYAPEDQFFWDKISTMVKIEYADNPSIELFHMWHEPQHGNNPDMAEMNKFLIVFQNLYTDDKLKFLEFKKNLLNE